MRARPSAGRGYSAVSAEDEQQDVEAALDPEDNDKQRLSSWTASFRLLSTAKTAYTGLVFKQKIILGFLIFCFFEQVLETALGIQLTGIGRIVLLPIRVAGYATHLLVIALPGLCALALAAWRWLSVALPGSGGEAGRPIAEALRYAGLGSLLLLALLALDGDPVVRDAIAVYSFAAAVTVGKRTYTDRSLRRTVRTWALFLPLIAHYKALAKWVQYTNLSKEQEKQAYDKLHSRYAPKVYQLMVDLGGLYVKAGQMLSLIPAGILPAAYAREFKKMQSDCPSRPSNEVQKQIAEALGRPIADVFSSFGDKPIGTASISQVHRAKMAKDGRDVVVKVQYPDLSESIDADFRSIALIIHLLDKTKAEEVQEAKQHFDNELDFEAEADTLERIHANLKKPFPSVRVPEPIKELCTSTVLVMTFIPGASFLDGIMRMAEALCKTVGANVDDVVAGAATKLTAAGQGEEQGAIAGGEAEDEQQTLSLVDSTEAERPGWKARLGTVAAQRGVNPVKVLQTCMTTSRAAMNMGVAIYNFSVGRLGATPLEYRQSLPTFDPVKLSRTLWRVHGHQLLIDGLFNSDPHPGNILIDESTKTIGLIDFGQICELKVETRVRLARLIIALVDGDDREIARRHAQLGYKTRCMSSETVALSARLRFGAITDDFMQKLERVKKLEKADPIVRQRHDDKLCMAERLITILRGTSFICGVGKAHSAPGLWLDLAQAVLKEHGDDYPGESGTEDVQLDLDPGDDGGILGNTDVAQQALSSLDDEPAWETDLVLASGGGDEEFFEVESEEER